MIFVVKIKCPSHLFNVKFLRNFQTLISLESFEIRTSFTYRWKGTDGAFNVNVEIGVNLGFLYF